MNPMVPPLANKIRRLYILKGNANSAASKFSAIELTELVSDTDLRLTNDGKEFILGFGGFDDRVIVIGTKDFLRTLRNAKSIFMGCYSIKVELDFFRHLYTFHCFVEGKIVPMIYALLFNNDKNAYTRMLRIIRDTYYDSDFEFNPSTIYIDVDVNIVPAIEEILGLHNKTIKLSLYHYANTIWQKVKSLGLSQNDDYNIEKTIRRMCFLALVPVEQVEETWTTIKNEAPQNENLLELISYITDTFMISSGGHTLNKTVWNHYDTDNIKTINHLEGWDDFIETDINNADLNTKACIIKLKNMHQDFEIDIITAQENSDNVSKIPQKYKNLEAKFVRAKERLENGTISAIEFLDEII